MRMKRITVRKALGVLLLAIVLLATGLVVDFIVDFKRGQARWLARAQELRQKARDFDQTVTLAKLPVNPSVGPVFRLDDRLGAAASTETGRGAAPQQFVFSSEFEVAEKSCFRQGPSFAGEFSEVEGNLRIRYSGSGYLLCKTPGFEIDEVGTISIRVRLRKGTRLRLGWSRALEPDLQAPWRYSVNLDAIGDGEFHTYTLNAKNILKTGAPVGGTIHWLFLKPSDADEDAVEVDFIRFVSRMDAYTHEASGSVYETLGRDMRRALFMVPPLKLKWDLQVPTAEPTLDFSMGVIKSGRGVRLAVSLSTSAEEYTVFDRPVTNSRGWQDISIDLARWGGQPVQLSLHASLPAGAEENVLLLANPIVYGKPTENFRIVLYVEDTLRSDHLSTYGYGRPTSPTKDRLAASGVWFENPIAQATKTRPSVASMMTSLLPTANNVWTFSDYLGESYLTLAEILRSQGFVTSAWIQNGNAGPFAGLHQGFGQVLDQGTVGDRPGGLLRQKLYDWLEKNAHRNFFLYIHVLDPHGPYDPPEDYKAWFESVAQSGTQVTRREPLDPKWVQEPTVEGRRALYDGEIANNDAHFARFLAELERLGMEKSTLLVFVSDHGEYLGEHGFWDHHPPGLAPVIRVPMIMKVPEKLHGAGGSRSMPVQLLDIAPTLAEAAGVDPGAFLFHGDSMLGLMSGDDLRDFRKRIVLSEEVVNIQRRDLRESWGSVFFRDWHMVLSKELPDDPAADQTFRVFNFRKDPQETRPLRLGFLERWLKRDVEAFLTELQHLNVGLWSELRDSPDSAVSYDPEVQEQLRALGYLN